jgi:hypothetical protein
MLILAQLIVAHAVLSAVLLTVLAALLRSNQIRKA